LSYPFNKTESCFGSARGFEKSLSYCMPLVATKFEFRNPKFTRLRRARIQNRNAPMFKTEIQRLTVLVI